MFALVDCNNFFVSCERVFQPEWNLRPVVILSNNDGCIIARSNEAKALGIPMGAPYFQYKNLIKNNNVIVRSSNYALYSDMSRRVMQVLKAFTIDFQAYSIDEAFLQISEKNLYSQGKFIRENVFKWTGIPVSVGIAPTKTLAKIANFKAKNNPKNQGIYIFDSQEKIASVLETFPVNDIWGIGKQLSLKLYRLGIRTAKQLTEVSDEQIKKHLTVFGLRTAWELRGISCLPLERESSPKKSITYSRAFGKPVDSLETLQEAVSFYTAQAGQKLRGQGSLTTSIAVFLEPHPFNRTPPKNFYVRTTLHQPTDYTPDLIHYARIAVNRIFQQNQAYRKAGVLLEGLIEKDFSRQDLFFSTPQSEKKQQQAMKAVDLLNKKFGCNTVRYAAEGTSKDWKMKQHCISPCYTTLWSDILTIKIYTGRAFKI